MLLGVPGILNKYKKIFSGIRKYVCKYICIIDCSLRSGAILGEGVLLILESLERKARKKTQKNKKGERKGRGEN